MKIPLSSPDITDLEIKAVTDILKTPHLSRGPKTREFEKAVADYIGVPYAIATNSGTSGLHLAVKALELKKGDEVITTPFSFISSSNCLLMENVKPVFVDVDPLTYNINPNLIERAITERTKAILPVDVFGTPCKIDEINSIAERHGLYIIQDSCEAIGAEYKGRKVGSQTDISVFAFYPNKQITTGEGGMILTSNENIADFCRSMRNLGTGKNSKWGEYERLGFNYHMDEMSAALGLAQFSRLEEILEKREQVAEMYMERLSDIRGIKLPYVSPDVKKSWFVFTVEVHESIRDKVIGHLQRKGIESRPYFRPIHLQSFYREKLGYKEGDFPITEKVASQNIALPFHNNLKVEGIDYVIESLKEVIK